MKQLCLYLALFPLTLFAYNQYQGYGDREDNSYYQEFKNEDEGTSVYFHGRQPRNRSDQQEIQELQERYQRAPEGYRDQYRQELQQQHGIQTYDPRYDSEVYNMEEEHSYSQPAYRKKR